MEPVEFGQCGYNCIMAPINYLQQWTLDNALVFGILLSNANAKCGNDDRTTCTQRNDQNKTKNGK